MKNKIENLFKKESYLILYLQNINKELDLYLNSIKKMLSRKNLGELTEQAEWFYDVFIYYKLDLIPALQERAAMQKRHIDLISKSPDDVFKVIKKDVVFHQKLTKKFFKRFKKLHLKFYEFSQKAKEIEFS